MSGKNLDLRTGADFPLYHELFCDAFPETEGTSLRSEMHYRWKYGRTGKPAEPVQYSAFEQGQPLGYYAALPFDYRLGDQVRLGGMVCDVMTHSAARGKGVFTAMGRYATDLMGQAGFAFVLGFPIRPYVFPGHLKVGWRIAFELPVYVRPVDLRKAVENPLLKSLCLGANGLAGIYEAGRSLTRAGDGGGASCRQVEPCEFFASAEYTAFERAWRAQYRNCLLRPGSFWLWRLEAPQSSYTVIALYSGERLAGIAVCRRSPIRTFQVFSLLDFMLLPEHRRLAPLLHNAVKRVAREQGTAAVAIMVTKLDAYRLALPQSGYFKTTTVFKLILKWLAQDPEPEGFADAAAWHLTWADTDNL